MTKFNVDTASRDAYLRILWHNWEPVTCDLVDAYGLSPQTTVKLKRRLRSMFAREGIVWGYDPMVNRFVAAPNKSMTTQRRIIESYIRHSAAAINDISDYIHAAVVSGNITPESATLAKDNLHAQIDGVLQTATKLNWIENNELAFW